MLKAVGMECKNSVPAAIIFLVWYISRVRLHIYKNYCFSCSEMSSQGSQTSNGRLRPLRRSSFISPVPDPVQEGDDLATRTGLFVPISTIRIAMGYFQLCTPEDRGAIGRSD